MIRRPPRSTLSSSSAASDVYKRQLQDHRARGPRRQSHRRQRRLRESLSRGTATVQLRNAVIGRPCGFVFLRGMSTGRSWPRERIVAHRGAGVVTLFVVVGWVGASPPSAQRREEVQSAGGAGDAPFAKPSRGCRGRSPGVGLRCLGGCLLYTSPS